MGQPSDRHAVGRGLVRGRGGRHWWLVCTAAAGSPWVVAALLGPFVGALLWGRDYWAGVVAGSAIWAVAVPAAASILVHYLIYWPLEKIVQLGRALLHRTRPKELPGPLSYNEA